MRELVKRLVMLLVVTNFIGSALALEAHIKESAICSKDLKSPIQLMSNEDSRIGKSLVFIASSSMYIGVKTTLFLFEDVERCR